MPTRLSDITLIAVDTETSGKYPLEAELCEIAAVKYAGGKVIDEYQTLVRTRKPMSPTVIGIHGITNAMVKNERFIEDAIHEIHEFIQGGILVAHHAPFDLGFLSVAMEEKELALPEEPVLCSSLLSRNVIREAENHRLQTLIGHLGLNQGKAHRALDDAKACLELTLKCFERAKLHTLDQTLDRQGGALYWKEYSLKNLRQNPHFDRLVLAIEERRKIHVVYSGGSKPGKERVIEPAGIVRNPKGDYVIIYDDNSDYPKRYYLEKITSTRF